MRPTNLLQQTLCILTYFCITSCGQSKSETTTVNNITTNPQRLTVEKRQTPTDFLPKGYTLFETIEGDLNKDGFADWVYIIKATDKNRIVKDKYNKQLDQNRRGIIVVFQKSGYYELAVKNYACFSSENEDGGLYFAPYLTVEIKDNTLLIHYGHGRYGYWEYRFQYKDSDFELISYVSSDGGPVIKSETNIDFVSKKKQVKVNTNANAVGGDEVFKTSSETINSDKLLKLSEIKDFDAIRIL